MLLDFSTLQTSTWDASASYVEVSSLGSPYREYLYQGPKGMILDTNGLPFSPTLESGVLGVRSIQVNASVGELLRVELEGIIIPGKGYSMVAARCHLCFAPLVKEGTERERDLKTGLWIERATGEYSCGTTVTFEPEKKLAVTPGAKVRIGPKCVKLLKKK